MRYYLGVDWADQVHAVWVVDEQGTKVGRGTVPHPAEGLSAWGRELDEWRARGIELWAAIERPEGRVVDFLLDHGVVVHPINPKALDRARDRFRQSAAKSDPFDARVLADFLRTDHAHLRALPPSSDAAQELKLLTDDYCQGSPHSEPPGSGKQSHPGSPIWSQAGSPMLSHPGAGIVSHPAGRDRISFAYPQPPCVAVGNKFVAGGDARGWTEESGDRHSRVASPSAVGRA